MTSLPSRLRGIGPTLQSIADQSRRPDRFVLSLPRRSVREGREYQLLPEFQPLLARHPWVEVHWVDEDVGPGTKLIGALGWLAAHLPEPRGGDVLMILDDDHVYAPQALGDLLREQLLRGPGAVTTYFAYFARGITVPQGADVVAFHLAHGFGPDLLAFHRAFVRGDAACFLVDDLWIGMYLKLCGRIVCSLREELVIARGFKTIYARTGNAQVEALEALEGEQRRDRATLRAFDGLLARLLAAGAAGLARWGGAEALEGLRALDKEVRYAEHRIAAMTQWLAQARAAGATSACPRALLVEGRRELGRLRHLYQMQAPAGDPAGEAELE